MALPGCANCPILRVFLLRVPTKRGIPENHRTTRRSRVVLSYKERTMREMTKVRALVGVVDIYTDSGAEGDGYHERPNQRATNTLK